MGKSRMQMAEMFDVNLQAISKHVQNIYRRESYKGEQLVSKMELVLNESGRQYADVLIYNDLDV